MDAGLKVRLNPDGGNQLNFREALRLYLAPIEEPDEQAEDDDYEENDDSEPRKNILDDYDYDDDFIDDGEVFEDEVAGTPPNEEQEPGFTADNHQESGKTPDKPPAHHGFGNFWVNKGDLPPKRDTAMPQPPSALGNVVLEHVKVPSLTNDNANSATQTNPKNPARSAQGKVGMKKTGDASKKPTSSAQTSGHSDPSKKPNQTNSVSGTNSSKPNNPRPSQAKGKAVQHTVVEEIGKLAALCQKEFGDKKPKLSDPKVQEQLHIMFRAAMAASVGKLFSDIAKDRRVVALADEVWNRLGFLRVKRANLETLGHALIWSAKEKGAIATVEKSESELERFMRERREQTGGTEGALMPVVFDNEVDSRIYDWYRAKSELQMAKNQLGSRVKSVKKCVGGWVVSLKKTAFQGWSVAEGEIVEAFRRVEDVRNAAEKQRREMEKQQRELERQRKESEKLEKKRKREEQLAAATAKRTALEKGGTAAPGAAPNSAPSATHHTAAGSGTSGAVNKTSGGGAGTGGSGSGPTASGTGIAAGVTTGVVKAKAKVGSGSGKNGIQGGLSKGGVTKAGKSSVTKGFAHGQKNGVKIVKAVKKDATSGTDGGGLATAKGVATMLKSREQSTADGRVRTKGGGLMKSGKGHSKTKEGLEREDVRMKEATDKANGKSCTEKSGCNKFTAEKPGTSNVNGGKSSNVIGPKVGSGKITGMKGKFGKMKSSGEMKAKKEKRDTTETEVIELD